MEDQGTPENQKMNKTKKFPTLRRIEAYYKDVIEITGRNGGKDDWKDSTLLGYDSILLNVLTKEEMDKEAKIFLYGLEVKMTPRSVAAALLLTWNMIGVKPMGERLFPEEDPGSAPADYEITKFEVANESYHGDPVDSMYDECDKFERRRAAAYLAASTLRLFSKSPGSWSSAWANKHFQKKYKDLMGVEFPFKKLDPRELQLLEMYDAYQNQKLYRGALGRILYALEDVKDTRLTDMLFVGHLAYTGLHIVPQFMDAKINIGASTGDLLSALDMRQNTPTLEQLKKLMDESLKPPGPDNRATWRFSRLFDHSAFAHLQSKYCLVTLAILAHINSMFQSSTTSDPRSIAVLQQLGSIEMNNLRKVAHNIHYYFTVTAKAENKRCEEVERSLSPTGSPRSPMREGTPMLSLQEGRALADFMSIYGDLTTREQEIFLLGFRARQDYNLVALRSQIDQLEKVTSNLTNAVTAIHRASAEIVDSTAMSIAQIASRINQFGDKSMTTEKKSLPATMKLRNPYGR